MDSEQDGPGQELADAMASAMGKAAGDIAAMMPRVRAALDDEAAARAKAAMDNFAAGCEEAAELARTTQFGYADWFSALACIDGHPYRESILVVLRDAAGRVGANPRLLARDLAESGILGDRGLWKPAVWERTLRRCEQATAPAFLFRDLI